MNFQEKYGRYALVTGASSGIGVEFARQLAAKKLNLVLVARRKERLDNLARELQDQYRVEVKTIAVDLTANDFMATIAKTTATLEVGLLVSNAGMMYIGNYLDNPLAADLQMIDLNIKAPAILTHHFAKKMVGRKKGGLIYTASMLGYMGTPYATTYAGTKAHEIVKGEGLAYELKDKGIDVLVLNPGLTDTEMTADNDFSVMPMKLMRPDIVARTAVEALGRKVLVTPGMMNRMMVGMSKRMMSRQMNTKMFGKLMQKTF